MCVCKPECRISVCVLLCLICLLFTIPAYAQYSSNIQGVVSDPAGAAINGATVQLRSMETGVTASMRLLSPATTALAAFPQETM